MVVATIDWHSIVAANMMETHCSLDMIGPDTETVGMAGSRDDTVAEVTGDVAPMALDSLQRM